MTSNRSSTFAMLCRIKSCIKKLSNLTNVGCHGENMLGRRRSCREGEVEDKTKEREKRREEAVVMWKD